MSRDEWRKMLKTQAKREVDRHLAYAKQAKRALGVALKLLDKISLDKIVDIVVEGIGEEVVIYSSGSNKIAHEIAGSFGITLQKEFNRLTGSMTYSGAVGTTNIIVKGVRDLPKCQIVRKKTRISRTVYEVVCGGNRVRR